MTISASTWQCTSESLAGAITDHGTTQLYPIGHRVTCVDTSARNRGEAEFSYRGGLDSTVAGDVVVFDGDITKRAVAADAGPIGVAMSACVTGEYGWYQIRGQAVVNVVALGDDAQAYLTATAGKVDATVATGDHVLGMRGMSADDTNQCVALLMYPKSANTDGS